MSHVILPVRELTSDHVGLRCSTGVPRQVTWSDEGLRDADTQRLLNPTLGWQITEVQRRPDGDVDLFLHALNPEEHGVSDILVQLREHDCVWVEETPIERLGDEVSMFLQSRRLSHQPVKVRIWEWSDEDQAWLIAVSMRSESWPELP